MSEKELKLLVKSVGMLSDSDNDSLCSMASAASVGPSRLRNKKEHRVEAFQKRKKEDLWSSSSGRGTSAKKADRRPINERSTGAPGGNVGATHQSSFEEDASAFGSDQERRADFAKTMESAFRQVTLKKKASRDSTIEAATSASFRDFFTDSHESACTKICMQQKQLRLVSKIGT